MGTKISWTDETWNPVVGCTKVSAGCDNCYAEKMARRFWEPWRLLDPPNHFKVKGFPLRLDEPLHWRKPRRVFVCSMGDLFHEDVPFEFIDKVMAVITVSHQHTFQILTKRPERMAEYFARPHYWTQTLPNAIKDGRLLFKSIQEPLPGYISFHAVGQEIRGPLPNLWLGTSIENQKELERLWTLHDIPGDFVRFVSAEPLLGPIEMGHIMPDWLIIGCESGPGRRPCKLEWVRSLIEQADAADIPVFVKQLDINGKVSKNPDEWPECARRQEYPE